VTASVETGDSRRRKRRSRSGKTSVERMNVDGRLGLEGAGAAAADEKRHDTSQLGTSPVAVKRGRGRPRKVRRLITGLPLLWNFWQPGNVGEFCRGQ